MAGDPLARVFAAFGRAVDPAGTAFATLEAWFDEGWIAGVVPRGARSEPPRDLPLRGRR